MFRQLKPLPKSTQDQLESLRLVLKSLKKVCVAYSGGVDSSLVATIAFEQLGNNALAVTGVSAALAPPLRMEARKQAIWLGIQHQECITNELQNPNYQQNPPDRCYACKKELHLNLKDIAKASKGFLVVDGVNHDDLQDHRPGIKAAKEAGVRSPLAEIGINKSGVREISQALGLPWWNKPAQPCLASRFPYGEAISEENLRKVGKAEAWLHEKGFPEVRVRIHGQSAKIELPTDQIEDLILNLGRKNIVNHFLLIGFSSVSIDLEGLVSGKLNRELKSRICSE